MELAPATEETRVIVERKDSPTKRNDRVSREIVKSTAEETDLRKLGTDMNYKFEYRNSIFQTYIFLLHVSSLFGLYYCFAGAKLATVLWVAVMTVLGNQAIVLGAHRAFSHRSYKPSKSLKLALIFFHTTAGQSHIFWWARDHRIHHKYTDTDADPYNSTRGFFFSHMKWYLVRKHPLVTEKAKQIDVSDLLEDKWLMFQKKYFWILYILIGVIFPIVVPMYVWNENFKFAFNVAYSLRLVLVIQSISTINSIAHMYGTKPFDKRIHPVQSKIVHWVTGGDGWHNFHHCFPWDYGLGELGYGKGLSTMAIEFFAKYGFATDLKKASMRVVEGHAKRHGDGSNFNY